MNSVAPRKSLKGRGAVTNRSGQFEPTTAHGFDDGWDGVDEAPPLRTTVTADHSRTVIARNKSPDVPFDRSINPYRGCEHGCAYCFARPSHAFLGLSPGQDFETRLFFKPEAAALRELDHRYTGIAVLRFGEPRPRAGWNRHKRFRQQTYAKPVFQLLPSGGPPFRPARHEESRPDCRVGRFQTLALALPSPKVWNRLQTH